MSIIGLKNFWERNEMKLKEEIKHLQQKKENGGSVNGSYPAQYVEPLLKKMENAVKGLKELREELCEHEFVSRSVIVGQITAILGDRDGFEKEGGE